MLQIKHSKIESLSIPTLEGFEFISLSEILYLQSDGNYTTFFLEGNRKIVATKNIGYYEQEFEADPFLRIHQSFIINLNKVKSYVRADNGYVILTNRKEIYASRAKKDALVALFRMRRYSKFKPNPQDRP